MNRHFGREVHAAGFGSRLRNNADNHLIERAIALACLLVLAIGVFLVMQPFLSALLWGIILTISTWPLHVRLTRAWRAYGHVGGISDLGGLCRFPDSARPARPKSG